MYLFPRCFLLVVVRVQFDDAISDVCAYFKLGVYVINSPMQNQIMTIVAHSPSYAPDPSVPSSASGPVLHVKCRPAGLLGKG